MFKNFNGDWKHIAIGTGLAVAGAAIHYLSGQDWSHLVGPTGALIVGGALQVGNEWLTNQAPKL
jgi:hypothetical protein